ncbi:unnamed protein product [Rotaria magnacalcarata]|uniref:Alpha-catulin n=1 Tax=Rotaria magnacalcarata TaxID=392030 RepID=A0A8S2JJK6_9BILA|nr:unnamed protein product [Rotaria magnacalcarata]
MASPNKGFSSQKSLEIKTKSIETTLVPLVTQISTLVHFKEKPRCSSATNEKTLYAINRVGEVVNTAVERFVSVGESIGNENPEIKSDLIDGCREARSAGGAIKRITCVEHDSSGKPICVTDRQSMVQAARGLLTAVTRVLLLADIVIVKQIISVKKKVTSTLNRLEGVTSFPEFVKLFGVYGTQMIDLAHLTGDRQNDLKDERRRSQLSASRTILEKSTMLILTSSKAYLRHNECLHARKCRDLVYGQVRRALDMVQLIVYDSGSTSLNDTSTLTLLLAKNEINFVKSLRQFEYAIEMLNVSSTSTTKEQLEQLYNTTIDNSQDFTDSIYISIEQREKVLQYHKKLQEQLADIIKLMFDAQNDAFTTAIQTIQETAREFRQQLEQMAIFRASEFFRTHDENVLLNELKSYSLSNRTDLLQESIDRFHEQAEIAIELSKLLRHISSCDQLQVSSEYHDMIFQNLSNMIVSSSQSLAAHPNSRVGKENLDALCRCWEEQINEFSILVKEIQDFIEGRREKTVYLSLPRPGKHGTTSKCMIRAKNMSSMTFSMYLFTRGEGTLRTTQDLFTQAYYFVEEGSRLASIVREFVNQIPNKTIRQEILIQLDQIPLMCHQLKLKLKNPVLGKSSTFSKVDAVISETRDLMNAVTRLCTTVFACQSKYKTIDSRSTPPSNNIAYSRPPLSSSKRSLLYRTTSIERDDHIETAAERSLRSSSLQRPSSYLPALDHI